MARTADETHVSSGWRNLLSFPNPVNETSARLVAAGVVAQAVAFLWLHSGWLLVPLVFGFAARVAAGPRFSPLGLLVTKVVTPRLPGTHQFVAGPPKRFAQGVGLAVSSVAAVAWLGGAAEVAVAAIIVLVVAATMEAVFSFCLGCTVFGWLMRAGVVPASVCVECADITPRLEAARRSLAA